MAWSPPQYAHLRGRGTAIERTHPSRVASTIRPRLRRWEYERRLVMPGWATIALDPCSHAIPAMQEEAAALIAGLVFAG